MDRKLPEKTEIQRLIRLSEASRSCLGAEVTALKHRLDVPARIRDSLTGHPSAWMLGSLASGLAASLLFRRSPAPVKKHRGISGALIGLTLTAARPLAKLWLDGRLKQWASGSSTATPHPAFRANHQNSPNPPHVRSPDPGPR